MSSTLSLLVLKDDEPRALHEDPENKERRFPEHSPQAARKCPLAGANRRGCFAKGKALAQPVPCPVLEPLHERGPHAQDDQESRKSTAMNGSISRNRAANSVTDGLLHLMSHSARSICANAAPAVTKREELTTMHDSSSVTSGKSSRNSRKWQATTRW